MIPSNNEDGPRDATVTGILSSPKGSKTVREGDDGDVGASGLVAYRDDTVDNEL